MTKLCLKLLLCCCFILTAFIEKAEATHAMGSDLTYEYIGNNQYRLNLTIYRDCNGIVLSPNMTITANSPNCGSWTIGIARDSFEEITPVCPGITGSACDSLSGTSSTNPLHGLYGIEAHYFSTVITLAPTCGLVNLEWSLCCRNNAITTLSSPGSNQMSVVASIDAGLQQNSPVFLNDPVPFYCIGQNVLYNHGGFDVEGDSLVYSLSDCLDMPTNSVSYAPNFSATTPLATQNGVSINAQTGALSFIPSTQQVGVVCVKVEEFRNGQKIGEVMRDIQITVVNCNNDIPTLSGVDGTNQYNTTATVGQQLCFDIISNDINTGQALTMTWDQSIQGASLNAVGQPFPTGTFCWTPTAADVGTHHFTVTIKDDYCPLVGLSIYTYTIVVEDVATNPCDSIEVSVQSTNDLMCSTADGAAVLVATGGTAPYTYQVINWTTGEFFSNTTGLFNNLTAGNYGIWVEDANGCSPNCSNTNFDIAGNPTPLQVNIQTQDILCAGSNSASITLLASQGTAPYQYSIDGGQTFSTTNTFNNLAAGTYHILVMDANGCSFDHCIRIKDATPLVSTLAQINDETCGQQNGAFSIQTTGGALPYTYTLNGQSNSNGQFQQLAAGSYFVNIVDANGCTDSIFVEIDGQAGFAATYASQNPTCAGACSGSITATATGSTGYQYAWSNGATGATVDQLCAGTYTVTITDAAACTQVLSVVITEPAPIFATLNSSTDETCDGNDGTALISVTGGTAPYNYQVANFNKGSLSSNTTGNFNQLQAGTHIVKITDANGCAQECALKFVLEGCDQAVADPIRTPTFGGLGSSYALQVNPNPSSGIAQVLYQGSKQGQVQIVDLSGRPMLNKQQLEQEGRLEVNVNDWPSATYLVILKDAEGKILKTTRMLVQ